MAETSLRRGMWPNQWRRHHKAFSWSRGILSVYGDASNFSRPSIRYGLEDGYVGLTFEIVQPFCDPLIAFSVEIGDKPLGRAILAAAVRWDAWRADRRVIR